VAVGKSSGVRVHVRWTGVRFGSKSSQLDTDHVAVPSLCGAIVPSSRLYVQCRKSARTGQSDFDLSPPAVAPRSVGAIAEDVLVTQLGRNVSCDRRKIVGIVESTERNRASKPAPMRGTSIVKKRQMNPRHFPAASNEGTKK
jgi:hypothetical protein